MKISCKQLNPGPCKTYLISNDDNKDIILIDPVIEHIPDYRKLIEAEKLHLSMVVDTHTHADHISGGASLGDIYGCDYLMHSNSPVRCAAVRVGDGSIFKVFGSIPVTVMHAPGHTRDSICLIFPEWIFTGDALFLEDGGAGRDDLPGGDPGAHWDTLRRMLELPEELIVYPAHDYRGRMPSSLKVQKKLNPHLIKCLESREMFVHYLEDLKLGPADWMKDVLKANYACARDPRAAWIPADSSACEVKGTLLANANDAQIYPISAQDLKQRLGSAPAPLLLDVREKDELTGPLGHIEGILHIPIGSLTEKLSDLDKYKNSEMVIVCRSGGRAATAARILTVSGFTKVKVLEGGMISWNGL